MSTTLRAGSFVEIRRVSETAPGADGANVIGISADVCWGMYRGTVGGASKENPADPERRETSVIAAKAVPMLETVTFIVRFDPISTAPNEREAGETETAGVPPSRIANAS
jgi:hypothetical protein